MKRILSIFLFFILVHQAKSQCFQIQSILVDACAGSQEGQNEMVKFQVGNTALNTANLSVNWPNNNWLGLTKNASTAADVATVNATIIGCGFLKEPTANVLPANAKVLLVTSSTWSPLAQSFAGLTDTLYIIFQTAGNTNGHFANFGSGLRTLSVTFSSPAACTDAVTYDRALLINQAGNVGGQDGGAVEFTPTGVASYVNYGCQAPFIPLSVNAGADKTICVGGTQSFTAIASGAYNFMNWSLGTGATGTFAPTNSLSTTYTPGAGETGTVKLYCTLFKVCGTQTTTVKDSVNLAILQSPNPVIVASTNSVCSGQNTTLSFSLTNASQSGTTSVVWLPSNLTTQTISVNTANTYSVQASNACGTGSNTIVINSFPSPTITLSSNTATICSGGTVTLTANSNSNNYSWSNPVSTSSAVVITTNTTTTGVVSTTNSCGTDSKSYTITVIQTPTLAVNNSNINLCTGQSFTVIATSNSPTYNWQPSGANTNSLVVSSPGMYTVEVSNTCGLANATVNVSSASAPTLSISSSSASICSSGQTATLSLIGSTGTYAWSNGTTASTTAINTSGVYSATVSSPGCGNATASITVGTLPLPTINIFTPSATTLCAGSNIVLTANSSAGNYLWPDGAITNTFSANTSPIVVTSTNSCGSSQATQTLTIVDLPTVTVTPNSYTLCAGSTLTLTALGNPTNYQWNTGETTATVFVNTLGIKTVSVSNACGVVTQTVNVISANFPPLVLSSSSATICPNETATLTVTGGSTNIYSWSNTSNTGSVVATNGGTITVSNTSACGVNSASIIVNIQNLSANILANPTSGTMPLTVSFTNNSTTATSYLWDFGNGIIANTQTVSSQIYTTPGTYIAYLTITNGVCMDIDSVEITVFEEGPTLYVPNAFTPNGDSINDFFIVGATNIKEFNIIIFDRWGLKMFESSDIKNGWDGKVAGNIVSDGVYFHLITAKGNDGSEIKKQGTITLFK